MSVPKTKTEYKAELIRRANEELFPAIQNSQCRYRTAAGKACAVGILIPDEEYDPSLDAPVIAAGSSIGAAWNLDPKYCDPKLLAAVKIPDGVTSKQLRELQNAHDHVARVPPKGWNAEEFIRAVEEILGGSEGHEPGTEAAVPTEPPVQ